MGADGAGHYVKMVHNGIEYGDMQLICEAYAILHDLLGLDAPGTGGDFHRVEPRASLNSYLIEITSLIFKKTDPDTGKPMVDVILDKAGQKGTGHLDAAIRDWPGGGHFHDQRRRRSPGDLLPKGRPGRGVENSAAARSQSRTPGIGRS